MKVLHSSRKTGRPFKELSKAWNIQFGGQKRGPEQATRLIFRAPTLGDAVPRLFEQQLLFEDHLNANDTAFDLVGSMLYDIANRAKESERYDADLLKRIATFKVALDSGLDSIHFGGHQLDQMKNTDINSDVIDTAFSLQRDIPGPKRVRVCGTLDMIRVSDKVFELLLKDGQRVRAVWSAETVVTLKTFLNHPVLIEGLAVFRPSGTLLRVDTAVIEPAREKDSIFMKMPQSNGSNFQTRTKTLGPRCQTGRTGINAVWGKWPGDETEEELLKALEDVS